MHREVSMHESRPEQQRDREQWTVLSGTSTIGHGLYVADRAQIYYCCKSFPVLLHNVMVG